MTGADAPGRIRLAGGRFGGRFLPVVDGVRPTEGRVREAVLSRWQHRLAGGTLLDLFAGSGAVGIEAAGRGAASVVLVESSPEVLATLARSVEATDPEVIRVQRLTLPGGLGPLGRIEDPFDAVFADPPYGFARMAELIAGLGDLVASGGEIAIEHSAREEVEIPSGSGLLLEEVRRYGETAVTFLRPAPGGVQER